MATINQDGSPHVTGVGALWVDGAFWFETGERTRKGRNIARDPRCTVSVAADTFDLVIEGDAQRVTDPALVAKLAARWAAEGWPARADETGLALTAEFSAPSAGPPPWFVYRITPRAATALATVEPGGATRWRSETRKASLTRPWLGASEEFGARSQNRNQSIKRQRSDLSPLGRGCEPVSLPTADAAAAVLAAWRARPG